MDLQLQIPLPLETLGEDPDALDVVLFVLVPVRAPLIVQFDVLGVATDLGALVVTLDVGDSVNDGLNVTLDIITSKVASLRSADVQAPVAKVAIT